MFGLLKNYTFNKSYLDLMFKLHVFFVLSYLQHVYTRCVSDAFFQLSISLASERTDTLLFESIQMSVVLLALYMHKCDLKCIFMLQVYSVPFHVQNYSWALSAAKTRVTYTQYYA